MTKAVILSMLKTKHSNLGLSEKSMGELADLILAKDGLTSDTLESEVDAIAPFAKLMQKESQRQVQTALANKSKEEEEKGEEGKEAGAGSGNDKSKTNEEVPAWAKALVESNNSLKEELTKIKQEKSTTSRKSLYEKELEGLPDAVKTSKLNAFNRMAFKDDADFTEFVETEKTSVVELKESLQAKGAGQFGSSFQKGGNGGGNKQASKDEVDSVLNVIL